jgi:hypothetical protein
MPMNGSSANHLIGPIPHLLPGHAPVRYVYPPIRSGLKQGERHNILQYSRNKPVGAENGWKWFAISVRQDGDPLSAPRGGEG